MLPLSGYVRVSKVGGREGEGFISPDVQEKAIKAWAENNGVSLVMERHELDVSGGTMDRPIFNEIMEKVRSGQSGGIVVYKLDRFARNLLGAVSTLAELGEHGGVLASATEPQLDYTTPAGKAFMQQMFVFNEFVRSTIKESWATAQRHAVERGIHISPTDYLGYDRDDSGRLVPNSQSPIATETFRRRGRGESWGSIAEWLNESAPRDGGKRWNGQAVQRLCVKRVYRGEASRNVDQDVDGRGPIVNPNAHPALVTEEEWQAAQMDPRIAQGGSSDGPGPLLKGLIRCAGCRYAMSAGNAHKELVYRCRRKHASGECPEPAMILRSTIEDHVEETVLAAIDGMAKIVPDSAERDRAMAELEQARANLNDFNRDRLARQKLGTAGWHEFLDVRLAAVREAQVALDEVDQRLGVVREGLTRDHYLSLPTEDRREVLAGFVDTVFVRRSRGRGANVDPTDERARILWRGQAPVDLPRRRVVNQIKSFDFREDDVEAGVVSAQDSA